MSAATTELVTYNLSADVFDSKFLLCNKVIQFAVLVSETEHIDARMTHLRKRYCLW